MKIIGITGGIGAGKTTVLNILNNITDCVVIIADETAKFLMAKDGLLSGKAYELFGENAYDCHGMINREHIAQIIYADRNIMAEWEKAVHPAVNMKIMQIIEKARKDNKAFVFVESALLIENNYNDICDEIWYVYAGEETRKNRLRTDRQYTEIKINNIFNKQLQDSEFRKHCSYVINTETDLDTLKAQLENKLAEYKLL